MARIGVIGLGTMGAALALNIAGMLVAFIALIYLVNGILSLVGGAFASASAAPGRVGTR